MDMDGAQEELAHAAALPRAQENTYDRAKSCSSRPTVTHESTYMTYTHMTTRIPAPIEMVLYGYTSGTRLSLSLSRAPVKGDASSFVAGSSRHREAMALLAVRAAAAAAVSPMAVAPKSRPSHRGRRMRHPVHSPYDVPRASL